MVVVELLTPHPTESREAELCSPSEAGATSDWTLVSEHPQGWGGGGGRRVRRGGGGHRSQALLIDSLSFH